MADEQEHDDDELDDADESEFELPSDAREFTQADAQKQRADQAKCRVDANGAVKITAWIARRYRKACPGELTHLRSILSKSKGLAVLFQGPNGFRVRRVPGKSSFVFGFAPRLTELEIEIPEGWYALVEAQVVKKVKGVDGPCLVLDLRNRELVEIKHGDADAAPGDQGPEPE